MDDITVRRVTPDKPDASTPVDQPAAEVMDWIGGLEQLREEDGGEHRDIATEASGERGIR